MHCGDACGCNDAIRCPVRASGGGDTARRVVIPLHQRLQMIKRYKSCSDSEARRLLWSDPECVGGAASDPWAHATVDDNADGGVAQTATSGEPVEVRVLTEPDTHHNTPSDASARSKSIPTAAAGGSENGAGSTEATGSEPDSSDGTSLDASASDAGAWHERHTSAVGVLAVRDTEVSVLRRLP